MAVSIRDMFCDVCEDHTAHMIFKSTVGELRKCLKCRNDYIVEDKDENDKGKRK